MQILSTLYCDNIPENKKDLDHFSIDYKFFTGYDNKEYLSFEVSSDNEYFERAFELKNCMIGMTRYGFSNEELDSANAKNLISMRMLIHLNSICAPKAKTYITTKDKLIRMFLQAG